MKICCLKGSPRKNGNTNALTDIVLEKLTEEGAAVNTFSLYEMEIKPCLACRKCQEDWTKVTCARQDDMEQIFTAVMECDILLLSTPIYSWYCTAPMKAALDRMVYALNMYYGEQRGPSLWEGKQLALITTCGYPPEKGTDLLEEGIRRYCKHSKLQYMGILCERHQGYHIPFMDEAKKEHAEAFARKLVQVQTEKGIDQMAVLDESLAYEILSVVEEIPEGRVASYGQIAKLIGREKNARLVGKVLSRAEYYGTYPCHRVVNHAGRTAPGFYDQRYRLESEGVEFLENGLVDMKRFQWDGA